MAKIFVTRQIPDTGVALLKRVGHEVVVSAKDGVLTPEELKEALTLTPYDALFATLSDRISGELIDAAPSIRMVANYAVGFDNIDLPALRARGIAVSNTPGVLTQAVAEHTIALMFALAKRVVESDRFLRAGKYEGWGPMLFLGTELSGKTIGIVGAGRIGSIVLKTACCIGMKGMYHDIARNETLEKETGAVFTASLEELLGHADVVSLHVPLLDSTKHLINRERLSMMKSSALLINTARGAVVDEMALTEALRRDTIRGAALDVFEHEPAVTKGLTELENVILTPHTASATEEARSAMSVLAAENIIAFFEGAPLPSGIS